MNESNQQIQDQHLTSLQPKEKFKMFLLFRLPIKLFLTKISSLKKNKNSTLKKNI